MSVKNGCRTAPRFPPGALFSFAQDGPPKGGRAADIAHDERERGQEQLCDGHHQVRQGRRRKGEYKSDNTTVAVVSITIVPGMYHSYTSVDICMSCDGRGLWTVRTYLICVRRLLALSPCPAPCRYVRNMHW